MGNNLAPTLAIIYMNERDALIVEKSAGSVRLNRYIDDYFVFLLSREFLSDDLLNTVNNLNDAIKFTIEHPVDNQLPFLDTMVTFNLENKDFLPPFI